MAKRSDIEVGETHLCNHRNSGGISPVELRRGGFYDPIGMDIFEMIDKIHRIRVCGSG